MRTRLLQIAAIPAALAALAMVLAPCAVHAQSGGAVDESLRGYWQWALADVAGGDAVRTTGKGTVRIPSPTGGELEIELPDDDSRRGGPPGHARGKARGHGKGGRAGGPSFCRSGVGHPVHGRRWCVEKGFGLGGVPWDVLDLGDVIFGDGPRRRDRLGLEDVIAVLGRETLDVILGRSPARSRRDLNGRWRRVETGAGEGRVLQLRTGTTPVAELNDVDGDGRVDAVLVFEGGR